MTRAQDEVRTARLVAGRRRRLWRRRIISRTAAISVAVLGVLLVLWVSSRPEGAGSGAGAAGDEKRGAAEPAAQASEAFQRGEWSLLNSGDNRAACETQDVGRYRYIILQWYMARDEACPLTRIRTAHPRARILAYQNVGAMITGPHTHARPSSCVTLEEADAHERDAPTDSWFLHGTAGQVLKYHDYDLEAANIGRASYQQRCAQHLVPIKADGFDGVFADDANVVPGHGLGQKGDTPIGEYPADAAYGTAMGGMVQLLAPAATRAGLLFVPNVGMDPWAQVQLEQALSIARNSSAFFREHWMRWNGPGPSMDGSEWEATATLQQQVEALGRPFLASTAHGPSRSGTAADQQYAVASFWLMWDGKQDSAWGYRALADPAASFSSAWGPDLGTPEDPEREQVGVGWQRRYSAGMAVVNPNRSRSQQFDLSRTYREPGGTVVSRVVLAPLTGMTLSLP